MQSSLPLLRHTSIVQSCHEEFLTSDMWAPGPCYVRWSRLMFDVEAKLTLLSLTHSISICNWDCATTVHSWLWQWLPSYDARVLTSESPLQMLGSLQTPGSLFACPNILSSCDMIEAGHLSWTMSYGLSFDSYSFSPLFCNYHGLHSNTALIWTEQGEWHLLCFSVPCQPSLIFKSTDPFFCCLL